MKFIICERKGNFNAGLPINGVFFTFNLRLCSQDPWMAVCHQQFAC